MHPQLQTLQTSQYTSGQPTAAKCANFSTLTLCMGIQRVTWGDRSDCPLRGWRECMHESLPEMWNLPRRGQKQLTCVKKMYILWWERLVWNSEENRRYPWSISVVLRWECSCATRDFHGWELVVVVGLILICVASTGGGDRLTCLESVKVNPKEVARRHRQSWGLLCW